MTDEKILFFIRHTRDLLEYVETGVMPETLEGDTDGGNDSA